MGILQFSNFRSALGVALICGAAGMLAACSMFDSEEKVPLAGERISVMALQKDLEVDDAQLSEEGLVMPAPWQNKYWPQAGGYPNHAMQNLALAEGPLTRLWRTRIGRGSSSEIPLTTQPIVIDGRVFTIDSHAELRAYDAVSGKVLWRKDIAKKGEDDPVISGGLGFAENVLFVTNGFNEVMALKPDSGEEIWRKEIAAPSRAAPSILNGRVFISTLDNKLIALDVHNGDFLWDYQGISESSGLVGAASAAVDGDVVIPAFSSGEMSALRVTNGSVIWNENLSNVRDFGGLSGITDIKGFPVVDDGLVFAVSFGGKMIAVDERSGRRVWQRNIGGSETPWVAGNHVFVLSSDNQLIALGRKNGAIRWVTDLPKFIDGNAARFTGPVMAGGRLIVVGTEGRVIEVNPDDGQISLEWSVGRTVLTPPVVADGVMYVVSEHGALMAFQ